LVQVDHQKAFTKPITKQMNKTKFLISLVLLLFSISSSAYKVTKHRDQLRLGYSFVEECTSYGVNSDGSLYITQVNMSCREPGGLGCRVGANNINPPSNDLEWADFTSAEKAIGITMINDSEASIDLGQASGSTSQTVTFVSPSNQSYYRTFTFSWITNTDGSVDSIFEISDPVNN